MVDSGLIKRLAEADGQGDRPLLVRKGASTAIKVGDIVGKIPIIELCCVYIMVFVWGTLCLR